MFNEIKYLARIATAGSKEMKRLEKAKMLFERAYKELNMASIDNRLKYSVSKESKKSEDVKNAEDLTEEDLYSLLYDTLYGVLEDSTYIPLRISTPEFFRSVVYEHSEGKYNVMSVPLAAKVEHLRQNMDEDDGTSYGGKRPHNLTPDDIVAISKEMGHPAYIVLQNNGRYAMVVSFYNEKNKKIVVSIDFASDKDPKKNYKHQQYMNGYNEGYYNIVVTQFEPDDLSKYLANNEVVYDKKKMNGKYQVGSGRIVTFTHDTPFINDTIPQPNKKVNTKMSLSEKAIAPIGNYTGDNIAYRPNIVPAENHTTAHMSMEEFANSKSDVWRNVDYSDNETKLNIMRETHSRMVKEGNVVVVSDGVRASVAESFPNLREVKKKERTALLKESMAKLKNNLRQFLSGLKNQSFEFEVHGKVLEAKLYSTGINEVLEKITEDKANMLYTTEEIFKNARYLYSTPDYDSDPNVYRWNYFYTPVQISDETVGVRIAVRDVTQGQNHVPESQIYNWGIKKDATLGDVQPVNFDSSHGTSSDASSGMSLDGVRYDDENRESYDVSLNTPKGSIAPIVKTVNSKKSLSPDNIAQSRSFARAFR